MRAPARPHSMRAYATLARATRVHNARRPACTENKTKEGGTLMGGSVLKLRFIPAPSITEASTVHRRAF